MFPPPPSDATARAKLGKRAIAILAFAQCVDFTEPQILNSMYPAVQTALHLTDSALGYLTALKRGVEIFSVLSWGILADRWNRKSVLAMSTFLGGIASIATGFAGEFTFFFIATMLINLGAAAMEGQTNSVLSDFYPVAERGKAFGLVRGLAYAGLILALLSFSVLAETTPMLGWRIAYWGFGALGIVASMMILRWMEEPPRGQTERARARVPHAPLRTMPHPFRARDALASLRVPTVIADAFNLFLLGFPKIMLINYSVTFFVRVRGLSQSQAILITLVGLLGLIAGSISGGISGDALSRRWGERARLITGQIALGALVLLNYFVLTLTSDAVPIFMGLAFCIAFGIEFVYSITRVIVSAALLPPIRTIGFAVGRMADSLGAIAASVIYAWLVSVWGIADTILWLSIGGGLGALTQYVADYFTFARDAARMQERLARGA